MGPVTTPPPLRSATVPRPRCLLVARRWLVPVPVPGPLGQGWPRGHRDPRPRWVGIVGSGGALGLGGGLSRRGRGLAFGHAGGGEREGSGGYLGGDPGVQGQSLPPSFTQCLPVAPSYGEPGIRGQSCPPTSTSALQLWGPRHPEPTHTPPHPSSPVPPRCGDPGPSPVPPSSPVPPRYGDPGVWGGAYLVAVAAGSSAVLGALGGVPPVFIGTQRGGGATQTPGSPPGRGWGASMDRLTRKVEGGGRDRGSP